MYRALLRKHDTNVLYLKQKQLNGVIKILQDLQSVHSDCSCHKRVDYKNVINIAKLLHLSAPHIHCRQKMLSRDFHHAFYGHVLNLAINNSVINWRPCHKSFLLHIKFENKWEWQSFCCGRVMFSFGRKSRCIFF